MLDLNHPELATEEDIACAFSIGLNCLKQRHGGPSYVSIRIRSFENITDTVEQALADKKIRMECEARERYERDRISLYASGRKTGKAEGFNDGFNEAISKHIKTMKKNNLSKDIVIADLIEEFGLSESTAVNLVNEHWK